MADLLDSTGPIDLSNVVSDPSIQDYGASLIYNPSVSDYSAPVTLTASDLAPATQGGSSSPSFADQFVKVAPAISSVANSVGSIFKNITGGGQQVATGGNSVFRTLPASSSAGGINLSGVTSTITSLLPLLVVGVGIALFAKLVLSRR